MKGLGRRAGLTFTPRGPYALGDHPVMATAPDGSVAVLAASVADREAPNATYLSCGVPADTVRCLRGPVAVLSKGPEEAGAPKRCLLRAVHLAGVHVSTGQERL